VFGAGFGIEWIVEVALGSGTGSDMVKPEAIEAKNDDDKQHHQLHRAEQVVEPDAPFPRHTM
jgi:hypothetical protein